MSLKVFALTCGHLTGELGHLIYGVVAQGFQQRRRKFIAKFDPGQRAGAITFGEFL